MKSEIQRLLALVNSLPNCTVAPPNGLPRIDPDHTLPDDLREFYELCGGVNLWLSSPYAIRIVSPAEVLLANPIIVGENCEDDISSTWYIIASDSQNNFLTIDFDMKRLGKCYDSFFDRHGIVGSCAVVARSFSELFTRLLENQGEYWYWLRNEFAATDAYD